jgi:ABC-type spermidine/putrescine transport system permease subunit I
VEVAPTESRRARRRREREAARESGVWYPRAFWPSFTWPALVWITIFFVFPFYLIFGIAFGTFDFLDQPIPVYQPWYWDLTEFKTTLGRICCGADAFYTPVYVRTFTYVALASAVCLVLGYAVAYFVARYGGRRRVLLLILLVMPFWISYLMRMYSWQSMLQEDGVVNGILRFVHLINTPINWVGGKPITVVLGLVYGYIPYMILPLYGALDRINQSLLEAGRDLGASPARTFFRVTLPLSRQAILAGIVIVTLPMFGDYYTNTMLSNSPVTNMIGNLVDVAKSQRRGDAKAASVVITLLVIVLVPMFYYLRSTRKATEHA